ncbi:fibroblast growth factor receptor-like [Ylistrum balloti]|uniref:fibroblast growth factor receptor-like n=1 Tax=Ylistrum balloti TaxID=509963 RepID=UPI002905E61D|nr:fibroblast growth factor receptor-like [Ylistrum balloti]
MMENWVSLQLFVLTVISGVCALVTQPKELSVNLLNSCSASIPGHGIINLAPLDNIKEDPSKRPRFYVVYKDPNDFYEVTYNYTFNPCTYFNEPEDPHQVHGFGDQCIHVSMCKFNKDTRRYYYYPYGLQKSAKFSANVQENKSDSAQFFLSFTGSGSVSMKVTSIHLMCNRSLVDPEDAVFSIQKDDERFGITAELRHLCCCPDACVNGLPSELPPESPTPDSSKLLVIVAVNAGVLLLACGVGVMCYLKRTHLQFYSKLPGVQQPAIIQYQMGSIEHKMGGKMGERARPSAYRDYELDSSKFEKKFLIPVLENCNISSQELELAQRLGGGVYGDTHVGHLNGMKVAVSRITINIHANQVDSEVLKFLQEEVWFLSRQRHRNIVSMMGLCVENKLPYIISEYVNGESVKYFIQHRGTSLTWPLRIKICLQTSDGMAYLHSTKPTILHRDLRCANIFITDKNIVKVGDFGLIKLIQPFREACQAEECCCQSHHSACPMSVRWTAPEVLQNPTSKEAEGVITTSSDVFSFGMVLLELITMEDPFDEVESEQQVSDLIQEGAEPELPVDMEILPQYKTLMQQCWNSSPEHRPTFKQVATRLKELIPQARNFQKAINTKHKVLKTVPSANVV